MTHTPSISRARMRMTTVTSVLLCVVFCLFLRSLIFSFFLLTRIMLPPFIYFLFFCCTSGLWLSACVYVCAGVHIYIYSLLFSSLERIFYPCLSLTACLSLSLVLVLVSCGAFHVHFLFSCLHNLPPCHSFFHRSLLLLPCWCSLVMPVTSLWYQGLVPTLGVGGTGLG